jgi:hypothetical protein
MEGIVLMGSSGIPYIPADIREEIAELEAKRQKLIGQVALPTKIKALKVELATLEGKKDGLEVTIGALIQQIAKDLTDEANKRISKLLKTEEGHKSAIKKLDIEGLALSADCHHHKVLVVALKKESKAVKTQAKKERLEFEEYKALEEDEISLQWDIIANRLRTFQINEDNLDLDRKKLQEDIALFVNEKELFKKNEKEVNEKFRQDLERLNKQKMEAYNATNKADDYFRVKRKEIEKKQKILLEAQGAFSEKIAGYESIKAQYDSDKAELDKDQKDLEENWKTFEQSNKNLERRIKKVNRREDDIKDKEARLRNG